MDVKITPTGLKGTAEAIASKSEAHRMLICAALADKESKININKSSEDIDATVGCLRALGADINISDGVALIKPGMIKEGAFLDCKESGSTLRFMLPVAAALAERVRFTGSGRLPERPIGELLDAMSQNGTLSSSNKLPLELNGKLKAGNFEISGSISSQYITGLMLALPLLEGESKIKLTSVLESKRYVDITLDVLRSFGIEFQCNETLDGLIEYVLPCGKGFCASDVVNVGGDWSNGAFFLVAGAMGNDISVSGLSLSSAQGDKEILDILKKFGVDIRIDGNEIKAVPRKLIGTTIDINETPDLLPILAVLASFADGETKFVNGARLRIKESDRLKSTAAMINNLGGSAVELPDELVVNGNAGMKLRGGIVDSFHDHRIAMSAAIAASCCEDYVYIKDAGATAKSYPDFYNDYKNLGGIVDVI